MSAVKNNFKSEPGADVLMLVKPVAPMAGNYLPA
jgi:hypothetical protein